MAHKIGGHRVERFELGAAEFPATHWGKLNQINPYDG